MGSVGVTQTDLWGRHVPNKREKRFANTDDTGGRGVVHSTESKVARYLLLVAVHVGESLKHSGSAQTLRGAREVILVEAVLLQPPGTQLCQAHSTQHTAHSTHRCEWKKLRL